jgi:hypothetical protein
MPNDSFLVYIATSLENSQAHSALAQRLRDVGVGLSYDWTTHGSAQSTPERWWEVAESEIDGVKSADLVIVLLPGGNGTHVELGAALASDKIVYLWAESEEALNEIRFGGSHTCVFYHHLSVKKFFGEQGLAEIVSSLASLRDR